TGIRVSDGDIVQGDVAIIGGYDVVVDDITHCTVCGLGGSLGDGQVRVLLTGGGGAIAIFCCAINAIIHTSSIEVTACIQVCLRDRMRSSAVQGFSGSQIGTVGRCTGEPTGIRVSDGDIVQGDVAIIGGYDVVVDDITHCTVCGLGGSLGDGQVRVLLTGGGGAIAIFCCAINAIVHTSSIEVTACIQVCLRDRMRSSAVQGFSGSQIGTVGRCTGQPTGIRVSDGDIVQSDVAIIGGYDVVVDDITHCTVCGLGGSL